MKFRILLKSFEKELMNNACNQLKTSLINTDCKVTGIVALPIRIKRFCVLRSPHVDKDSREHFELRIHKRIIEIHYDSSVDIFNLLSESDLPSGVLYRILLS